MLALLKYFQFFQIATMTTINYNLRESTCLNQIGLTFGYFAMIGHTRCREDLAFTSRISSVAYKCLRKCSDPSTVGRGITVLIVFTSHLLTPISDHIEPLNEAVELALTSGDKHLFL